jgi:hypothetical protein
MIAKAILPFAIAVSLCGCLLPIPTTLHVRGYVLDAGTNKPLSGARVTIKDHPKATVFTATDGSFDIPAETHWGFIVPPQEPVGLPDTVVVTKGGYRPKTTRCSYEECKIMLERE